MKLVICKETLFEFLVIEADEISETHISEVYKVIKIVLNKYHSKYFRMFSDLESRIMQVILERRMRFDPKQDAYNYIFTMARNESGNFINKFTREFPVEEFFGDAEKCNCGDAFQAEGIIGKFQPMLTGVCDKNFVRISRDDAISLLLEFAEYNPSLKKVNKSFTKNQARQLYLLIKNLLTI